jgi:hypothetical protein
MEENKELNKEFWNLEELERSIKGSGCACPGIVVIEDEGHKNNKKEALNEVKSYINDRRHLPVLAWIKINSQNYREEDRDKIEKLCNFIDKAYESNFVVYLLLACNTAVAFNIGIMLGKERRKKVIAHFAREEPDKLRDYLKYWDATFCWI